jgi:hypothetical protein
MTISTAWAAVNELNEVLMIASRLSQLREKVEVLRATEQTVQRLTRSRGPFAEAYPPELEKLVRA